MIIHLFPQELLFKKSLIMFYIDTWNWDFYQFLYSLVSYTLESILLSLSPVCSVRNHCVCHSVSEKQYGYCSLVTFLLSHLGSLSHLNFAHASFWSWILFFKCQRSLLLRYANLYIGMLFQLPPPTTITKLKFYLKFSLYFQGPTPKNFSLTEIHTLLNIKRANSLKKSFFK